MDKYTTERTIMKSRTNIYCALCIKARNMLNGRYCTSLHRYVEYAKQPPCKNK